MNKPIWKSLNFDYAAEKIIASEVEKILTQASRILSRFEGVSDNLDDLSRSISLLRIRLAQWASDCAKNEKVSSQPSYAEMTDPAWVSEVRILREVWYIPDFRGRQEDGDAYDFYMKFYGDWDALMTQKYIGILGWDKLLDSLRYSARVEKVPFSDLIPMTREVQRLCA